MTKRRILSLVGTDALEFLQGLVTNDVTRVAEGLVYAAMLTPQGKYIADFFLAAHGEMILLDVADPLADTLTQRLTMYKLRADVTLAPADLYVHRGLGPAPADGWPDPRHEAMGWRAYRDTPQDLDETDWTALRVAHLVPESGVELTADTFILEAGFERLHGVDFRKGCYVGQEVTARMKHKTELRKGLARVSLEGDASPGTAIEAAGKSAGVLHSVAGSKGIAYLRFDRATDDMRAGDIPVRLIDR